MESLSNLSDEEFLKKVNHYGDAIRCDQNPLLIYTSGVGEHSSADLIEKWVDEEISVDELFAPAINDELNALLQKARYNLKRTYDENVEFFDSRDEWNQRKTLSSEHQRIICLERSKEGMDGKYEVLDGAHRSIGFIRSGVAKVGAYVGYFKA